jgi:hypothetical protein
MNRDEIIENVITLLREHEESGGLVKLRGSIHQEPYKRDFFNLFAEAFNAGLMRDTLKGYLSADALNDVIAERAPDVVGNKTFRELHTFWQGWTYAWEHIDLKR